MYFWGAHWQLRLSSFLIRVLIFWENFWGRKLHKLGFQFLEIYPASRGLFVRDACRSRNWFVIKHKTKYAIDKGTTS